MPNDAAFRAFHERKTCQWLYRCFVWRFNGHPMQAGAVIVQLKEEMKNETNRHKM